MNSTQAREIPIVKVLQNLGFETTKSNEKESWYLSPFRTEKSASFKVNKKINRWFDHGEQKGGNVIDLVILIFGYSVTEALQYLKNFNDIFYSHKQTEDLPIEQEKSYRIKKRIRVLHIALINYLETRGVTIYHNVNNLQEIHYTINDKDYFALGFRNNSGGFEIRSKYSKISLGTKDVTLIKNNCETLRIFEGFFDYLSFIQMQELKETSDFLILNSVALLNKNISILNNYNSLELYLDNDSAGDKCTNFVLENFANATDWRIIYKNFKDYNEWFSSCNSRIYETQTAVVKYKRR